MNTVIETPQALLFLIGLLALAGVLLLARTLGFKCLRAWDSKSGNDGLGPKLRPAELAYVYKEGDMVHTIAVLCFDLIHRQIKSAGKLQSDRAEDNQSQQELLELDWEAPVYETRVMARLKSQSLDWLNAKTNVTMPDSMYSLEGIKFFYGLFKRISYFYKLVMASSKQLFTKVIKDPKKIFSYISFAGVGRFTADILSSGYQNLLEEELVDYLRQNSLICKEENCRKLAAIFFILAFASCLVVFYLLYLTCTNISSTTAQTHTPAILMPWLFIGFACFNAVVLKLLLGLRSLIPMYEELNRLLVNIEKSSSLVKILRFLLNAVGTMSWIFNIGILLLLNASQMLVLHFMCGIQVMEASLIELVASLAMYMVSGLLIDGWKLLNIPIPSQDALTQVKQAREKLKEVNALKSLQNTVSSSAYSTEFAELIAVYGIEVLWLLS